MEVPEIVDNDTTSDVIEKKVEDLEEIPLDSHESDNSLQVPIPDDKSSGSDDHLLKQEKIDQIFLLKGKLSQLIENIRDTKLVCDKYENENQYLQDYVGNYMKSDLK